MPRSAGGPWALEYQPSGATCARQKDAEAGSDQLAYVRHAMAQASPASGTAGMRCIHQVRKPAGEHWGTWDMCLDALSAL